jgi:hypothetical protein
MSTPSTCPPAIHGERQLPETVRTFLIERERRVLSHCQKLLADDNLPRDERRRLLRLSAAADQQMQRLAGRPGIEAA